MEQDSLCSYCKHYCKGECVLGETPIDEDECHSYEEEGYGETWV